MQCTMDEIASAISAMQKARKKILIDWLMIVDCWSSQK